MAENSEKTEKERENSRKIALANVTGGVGQMASFYTILNNGFGDPVIKAAEKSAYRSAFSDLNFKDPESGDESDLAYNMFASSRQDGKVGTGLIKENELLESATKIYQTSLQYLRVEDLFNLMGAGSSFSEKVKRKISEYIGNGKDVKDFYVSDLPEDKMKNAIGLYATHGAYTTASKALSEVSNQIPGDLERMLLDEDDEQKAA